jgi:hypothetical protein
MSGDSKTEEQVASTTAVDMGNDGVAVIKQTSEYTDVVLVPDETRV